MPKNLNLDSGPRHPIPGWNPLRAFLPLLALFIAGCSGEEYPQTTIDPVTDFGWAIHSLYTTVFWWTVLILVIVWVALAWVLIRYRAREGAPTPKPVEGHLGLEIGWTVGPALIVIAIAIPTIRTVFATQRPLSEDALEVRVTGHRYWWDFYYPEYDVRTANELRLPTGRAVTLRMHTNDVIHSFWIPRLGGKRDLNPLVAVREGDPKYNYLFFTVEEPGTYLGQCAEFCGEAHAWMGMRVIAETEEEFLGWVDEMRTPPATYSGPPVPGQTPAPQPAALPASTPLDAVVSAAASEAGVQAMGEALAPIDPLIAEGGQIFHGALCTLCHVVQGVGAGVPLGPNLTRFGSRATIGAGMLENNQENLVRWILDPQGVKPGAIMPGVDYSAVGMGGQEYPATGLTEDQVRAVAAYLLSLK